MLLMVPQALSAIPFISWCLGAAKETLIPCCSQSEINSADVNAVPASALNCLTLHA